MRQIGNHAVVLGAGMAGLLAARVLTEFYEQVTLVERDQLAGDARRGVPQGRHAHALMPRGTQILDELCPGLIGQLVEDGAVLAEPLADFRFRVGGHPLRQVPIGAFAVQASRPFLESHLRDRVRGLPGVGVVAGCDVVGLLAGEAGGRITGVRIMRRAPGSAQEAIAADLVVDAMGRGGRTPAWLESLGYARPVEERPRIDLGYASRRLRFPASTGIEKAVGTGPVPGLPRGLMLLAVEDGHRLLTLAGIGAAHRPPADPAGFLDFAATVAPPDVMDAIRAAEPAGEIATYRFPCYLRRRYERVRRLPAGLLVMGDALCSFNPIYAQGMTVAALQALTLRHCLARGEHRLARRFFRASARIVADPWRTAVNADLALPEVDGARPVSVRLLNGYVDRVLAAAERDDVTARQFMRVTGLLDAPTTLFRPGIVRRVLGPSTSTKEARDELDHRRAATVR